MSVLSIVSKIFETAVSDTEAPFLDLHLTISEGFVSSKFLINLTILILIL